MPQFPLPPNALPTPGIPPQAPQQAPQQAGPMQPPQQSGILGGLMNPNFMTGLAGILATRLGGAYGGYTGLGMFSQLEQMRQQQETQARQRLYEQQIQSQIQSQRAEEQERQLRRTELENTRQQAAIDSFIRDVTAKIESESDPKKVTEFAERLAKLKQIPEDRVGPAIDTIKSAMAARVPPVPKMIDEYVDETGNKVGVFQNPDGTLKKVQIGKTQPKESTDPTSYREYQLALKDGSFKGTYNEWLELEANRKRTVIGPSGLPGQAERRVWSLSDKFGQEPITKKFNIVTDALQFVRTVPEQTNNPAYDQALIYAFAKAMDPDSVVREGEYATVQKYAQSWIDNFGFNAMRVLSNREFLTPEARRNMKKVIEERVKPVIGQYKNLHEEYTRRINQITKGTNGADYLVDYAKPLEESAKPKLSPEAQKVLDNIKTKMKTK